jgi:hypothetical protein
MFNLALLIHGEEALLAVSFIFTIHFFNGHLRPEKFPLDKVIFTGTLPEEELRHERPAEYERLRAEGKLDSLAVAAPTSADLKWARVAAVVSVALGLALVSLTILALVR